MFQCPWIPEQINRFGDMHLLFDDALAKDGKIAQNGTGENVDDILEAFKYTFSKPGNLCIYQLDLKYEKLILSTFSKAYNCNNVYTLNTF